MKFILQNVIIYIACLIFIKIFTNLSMKMVNKSRTRANNCAELGLAICAEIAKIHEAELEIESEINNGTTIKILFN